MSPEEIAIVALAGMESSSPPQGGESDNISTSINNAATKSSSSTSGTTTTTIIQPTTAVSAKIATAKEFSNKVATDIIESVLDPSLQPLTKAEAVVPVVDAYLDGQNDLPISNAPEHDFSTEVTASTSAIGNATSTVPNSDSSKNKQHKRRGPKPKVKLPTEPRLIQSIPKRKEYSNHTYHDYSSILCDPSYQAPTSIADMSFVEKIHDILSKKEYEPYICWKAHGRAFGVVVPTMFEKIVCPIYFQHRRYSSFLRQLNNHGFKHLTKDGPDRNCYYHESFLRGMIHLCQYMPEPKDARRLIPDPMNEPNFDAISQLYPVPPPSDSSSAVMAAASQVVPTIATTISGNQQQLQTPPMTFPISQQKDPAMMQLTQQSQALPAQLHVQLPIKKVSMDRNSALGEIKNLQAQLKSEILQQSKNDEDVGAGTSTRETDATVATTAMVPTSATSTDPKMNGNGFLKRKSIQDHTTDAAKQDATTTMTKLPKFAPTGGTGTGPKLFPTRRNKAMKGVAVTTSSSSGIYSTSNADSGKEVQNNRILGQDGNHMQQLQQQQVPIPPPSVPYHSAFATQQQQQFPFNTATGNSTNSSTSDFYQNTNFLRKTNSIQQQQLQPGSIHHNHLQQQHGLQQNQLQNTGMMVQHTEQQQQQQQHMQGQASDGLSRTTQFDSFNNIHQQQQNLQSIRQQQPQNIGMTTVNNNNANSPLFTIFQQQQQQQQQQHQQQPFM